MSINEHSQERGFVDVVTVFLTHQSRVLILKRSKEVGTYREHWAGVSGYLESSDPVTQAYIEMAEEVGLNREEVTMLKVGKPFEVIDKARNRAWRVHPFLFAVHDPEKIRLDWENIEMRWISPDELASLRTVPDLREALDRVTKGD